HCNGFGAGIFLGSLKHRGEQAPPQDPAFRSNWIRKDNVIIERDKATLAFRRSQAIADYFLQAKIDQNIADMLLPFVDWIASLWGDVIRHTRFRNAIIAVAARDFFDYIGNTNNPCTNIQAMRGGLYRDRIARDRALEFEPY